MATIGLDKLFYSKITEDASGNETYEKPKQLAKAISADLSVELNEATLYADDGQAEAVKEFKSGTLSLGIDDIGQAVAADLVGATIETVCLYPAGKMPQLLWRWVSGRGRQTASISITGCIAFFSAFLRPTWRQRGTASPFLRRPSKARSSAETRWMRRITIPGKRK